VGGGAGGGGLRGAPAAAAPSLASSWVSRCAINNCRHPAQRGCHQIFIPAVTEPVKPSSAQAGGSGVPTAGGCLVGGG